MIYSAFKPILALHIVNFSSCQNYWGGGGQTICLPPPPPYKYIIFVGTFGGLAPPPNTNKLATLVLGVETSSVKKECIDTNKAEI